MQIQLPSIPILDIFESIPTSKINFLLLVRKVLQIQCLTFLVDKGEHGQQLGGALHKSHAPLRL